MPPHLFHFFLALLTGCLPINNILAFQKEFPSQSLEPEPITMGNDRVNGTTVASFFVEYHNSNRTVNMTIAMKWIDGVVKAECRVMPSRDYPFYVNVNGRICNKVCWENMRQDNDALGIFFMEDPNSFFFVIRRSETRYLFLYDTCVQSIETQKCRLRRTPDVFMCVCDGVEVCDRSSPKFLERSECTTTRARPSVTSTRKPTTTSKPSAAFTVVLTIVVSICLLLTHID